MRRLLILVSILAATQAAAQPAPVKVATIAPKGSIALNGTSLTVNEVNGATFGINVIPHTKEVTTWGAAKVGDKINLEVDTMARYVARLQEWA